ncbi:proteasomal ubiquitin receptor ADRM1 isoform X1 [Prorops nasuta]|uniref:proteasomal ubiquitin receptor ADRM1 isoform X1 n=1 Tax=Prorops nasuta TaxID=863751 RepID=UPI0034CD9D67
MSGGPLFGNNAARGTSKNLVEFKAGKMTMKGKMVFPDTRKGQVYVYQSDDSLMHFCWRDRTTGVVGDDLIIFPDDCEFVHVPQCKTGRVYLLRFKSTSRKFFFWLQDLKTDKDEENCRKVNEVLNNPPTPGCQRSSEFKPDGDLQNLLNNMTQHNLMQLFGGLGQISGLARPTAAQTPAPTAVTESSKPSGGSKSSSKPAVTSAPTGTTSGNNRIQISDIQNFLSGIPTPAGAEPVVQRGVATELTNAIPAAISATECLERAMSTHLPPGDNLCTTLSSPQFSQALSMFWSALQSGQAGPVIRQFGLGPDAVNAAASGNIEEFVTALETETKGGQGQTQSQPSSDDKTKKQSSPGDRSPDKKDDDDEGMALD